MATQIEQVGLDQRVDIEFAGGESYRAQVRQHTVTVDQPAGIGGDDTEPTPTELFVVSLATCVAFYAGRYLTRHGMSRDGLRVTCDYEMSTDRPARVSAIRMTVHTPPDLPERRRPALAAVVSHCTVHNSITTAPDITIDVTA